MQCTIFDDDEHTQTDQNQWNNRVTVARKKLCNLLLMCEPYPKPIPQHHQQQENRQRNQQMGQLQAGEQRCIDADIITAIGNGARLLFIV